MPAASTLSKFVSDHPATAIALGAIIAGGLLALVAYWWANRPVATADKPGERPEPEPEPVPEPEPEPEPGPEPEPEPAPEPQEPPEPEPPAEQELLPEPEPVPEEPPEPEPEPEPVPEPEPEPKASADGLLDINAISFEQLRDLRLSITQATRLLAWRERLGGFTSVDQIDEVPGLPMDVRDELKSKLRV
jgi:hypothetical protein